MSDDATPRDDVTLRDDDITLRDDDLDAFFRAPFEVYPKDSLYVSPLKSDLERALDVRRNPLFGESGAGVRRVLTAHRGDRVVGRIVAHVHGASNRVHGERRGCFGFFDCADDIDVARRLLGEAERFARGHGCDVLAGNFNLTAMQQMGVLTDGFKSVPYSDMQYNPRHIPRLLEECGFAASFPVSTFELDLVTLDPASLLVGQAAERPADSALHWAELRTRDFARVLDQVRIVLNDGFARNPMFVPLTPEEMGFQAQDLSHVLDPRITALVHDNLGPVGVILCIPDLNPMLRGMRSRLSLAAPWHFLTFRLRARRRAVIIFYSVAARLQGQGLNGAMLHRVTTALKSAGYRSLGITWIADVNGPSLRQVERLGARRLHRLHLFTKRISE
jgi:GNAT superfamily N-acetyltransferase